MSLFKYVMRQTKKAKRQDGMKEYWGMADELGAPLVSADQNLQMTAKELDEDLVDRLDGQVRMFDLSVPEELDAYRELFDKEVNGVAMVRFKKHLDRGDKMVVYVEWVDICLMRKEEMVNGR